jgi:hypothetical protein
MALDGAAHRGLVAGAGDSMTDGFSLAFWLKVDSTIAAGTRAAVVSIMSVAPSYRFVLTMNLGSYTALPRTHGCLWAFGSVWGVGNIVRSTSLLDDAWHHIAVTYDSTSRDLTCYVDGLVELQRAAGVALTIASTDTVNLGVYAAGAPANYMKGWLADAAIFAGESDAATVTALAAESDPRRHGAEHVYLCGDWDRSHHPAIIDRGRKRVNGAWVNTAITDYTVDGP